MTRQELRQSLRQARKAFVASHAAPFPILPALAQRLRQYRCIGGYQAIGSEASVEDLLIFCAGNGIETALPCTDGRDVIMRFRRWQPGDALERSDFGFDQPLSSEPVVTPDCLLVPLVGFDVMGNRLGQGAGHYDRYIASNPGAERIGIAWSVQQCDSIRGESWDMPLDAVCTEDVLIDCRINRSLTS